MSLDLISLLEDNAFATWVRESPSLFAYTGMLSLHAMGLAVVVGLNVVLALSLLGVGPRIPIRPARTLFPVMYAGFWVNALSGFALLAASASAMLPNPTFYVKIVFIVAAVINLRLFRNSVFGEPALANDAPVPRRTRILAITSIVLWGAAIVSGRLTAYPGLIRYYFG
jgi:hypothetical protein